MLVPNGEVSLRQHMPSDEVIIERYGHLDTNEVALSGLSEAVTARIAQLQLQSLHSIPHSPDELSSWTSLYILALGPHIEG